MGKALGEIGQRGAWRYALGQLQATLLQPLLLPPQARVWLLRAYGAVIGPRSLVHPVAFSNLYRGGFRALRLGRDCFVGEECFLDLADRIELGDRVTLAARVTVLTQINVGYRDHPLQRRFPPRTAPVMIGAGSFVGSGAILLSGVTLGERCLVGAGALVRHDLPPGSVVAGPSARAATVDVPARPDPREPVS